MKPFITLAIVATVLTSCAGIQVISDYDSKAPFAQYKTFAFLKEGIDKAEVLTRKTVNDVSDFKL